MKYALLAICAVCAVLDVVIPEAMQQSPKPIVLHGAYGVQYKDYEIFKPAQKPVSKAQREQAEALAKLWNIEVK